MTPSRFQPFPSFPTHLRAASLLLILTCAVSSAQTIGPPEGHLVIVGGGPNIEASLERFVELAGGASASIVVIPTANGNPPYAQDHRAAKWFRDEAGMSNVTVLHTDDREEADSDSFTAPLREARGVWFPGGRQWRIADSYLGTRTQAELVAVLSRGGVIGGTSAGATIQGSYLARGDSKTNTIMMGDHEEGFGYLNKVAIDQHLLKRNRQFDLLEIVRAKPDLLGIGLDEDTGIVVQGDRFQVVGEGYVAIYDPKRSLKNGHFYLLTAGDEFDLAARRASRPGTSESFFEELFADN